MTLILTPVVLILLAVGFLQVYGYFKGNPSMLLPFVRNTLKGLAAVSLAAAVLFVFVNVF